MNAFLISGWLLNLCGLILLFKLIDGMNIETQRKKQASNGKSYSYHANALFNVFNFLVRFTYIGRI